MLSVINILPILKKHFETLKEDMHLGGLITLFFLLPMLLSFILLIFNLTISTYLLTSLITVFAIFVGFIINVLVMLIQSDKDRIRIKNELIEHLSYNSLYALILGIVVLMATLFVALIYPMVKFTLFVTPKELLNIEITLLHIISLMLYFLIFNFVITLLMISKRLFVIYHDKFKEKK